MEEVAAVVVVTGEVARAGAVMAEAMAVVETVGATEAAETVVVSLAVVTVEVARVAVRRVAAARQSLGGAHRMRRWPPDRRCLRSWWRRQATCHCK